MADPMTHYTPEDDTTIRCNNCGWHGIEDDLVESIDAIDNLSIAKERADWLLDAVACATQDRRFLRGDPEYDEVAGVAILLNAEKAILTALRALSEGKT